jgi:aminopeptidase N
VLSHEIGHQWWGNQLIPASVEGAPVLTESLAWYSAMQVVKQAYGNEHLDRLLDMMQREYLHPREHAEAPLLRATSHFEVYRVGPFAMRALCEYIGAERVNVALRRLLRQYRSASQPLPVSLDLYRELQTQTPDSLHYLVHDLFAANTYWALKARKARAKQLAPGRWQVQFDVQTKKVTIDGQGNEQTVPMNDFVEIGIYAPGQEGQPGPELYRRQHRLQAGSHTITVEVAALPAFAGIDPRQLLIDRTLDDNFQQITLSPKQ